MQHRPLYIYISMALLTPPRELNSTDPFNFFTEVMLHEKVCKIDSRAINVGTIYATTVNNFPVIGDPCFAHRIMGSPAGKHCESLQRSGWRVVVSPLKSSVLDIECCILP